MDWTVQQFIGLYRNTPSTWIESAETTTNIHAVIYSIYTNIAHRRILGKFSNILKFCSTNLLLHIYGSSLITNLSTYRAPLHDYLNWLTISTTYFSYENALNLQQ